MRTFRHYLLKGLVLAALLVAPPSRAADDRLTDVQAQLVIIHNFLSHYVRWPGRYSLDETRQIYVCSLGEDKLSEAMPLLEKASTDKIRVTVVQDPQNEELTLCHVMYFAESGRSSLAEKLKKMKKFPVLTVSAIRNFTEMGGMVELEVEVKRQGNFEHNYVRYSLNSKALTSAQLFIEPDALELASRVIRQ